MLFCSGIPRILEESRRQPSKPKQSLSHCQHQCIMGCGCSRSTKISAGFEDPTGFNSIVALDEVKKVPAVEEVFPYNLPIFAYILECISIYNPGCLLPLPRGCINWRSPFSFGRSHLIALGSLSIPLPWPTCRLDSNQMCSLDRKM